MLQRNGIVYYDDDDDDDDASGRNGGGSNTTTTAVVNISWKSIEQCQTEKKPSPQHRLKIVDKNNTVFLFQMKDRSDLMAFKLNTMINLSKLSGLFF